MDNALTEAISAAMGELYTVCCEHDRTTATTYINDKIVVCVLRHILTESEDALIAEGADREVIDEFTVAVERLTHRRVTVFMGANQTTPGIACELFFLDAAPLAAARVLDAC